MTEDKREWKRENFFTKLFEELDKFIENAISTENVREQDTAEGTRIREFEPFIYGYSIKIGPDGKPEITEYGNITPPSDYKKLLPIIPNIQLKDGEEISSEREPLVDIYRKNNEVKVIIEMPGIEESNISFQCMEKTLTIMVNNEKIFDVELPVKVDTKNFKHTYRNGILEVTLKEQIK